MRVCWQGAARGLLRQQWEAAALSAGDHRMADSQRRGAVGAAAHRRRRGGRPAPEGVPPGNVECNTTANIDETESFCPRGNQFPWYSYLLKTKTHPYRSTRVLR